MEKKTDAELVARVRDVGDTEAFGVLVRRYQGHVYGLAYSLLGDWAEAQDMAQETFVRAYVNLGALREPAKFAAWLRRVAFGTCMDWLRTFRPEMYRAMGEPKDVEALQHVAGGDAGPVERAEKTELADVVLGAIAKLPAKYRIPITMFHLDGLSYERVAEFLDVPLGTAKSLIHHAKKMLKPALESYAKEVAPMVEDVFNEHKLPRDFAERMTQLVKAAGGGDAKTVKMLLDADEKLARAKDERGVPAIRDAAAHGHREIVEMLLARGADINARDDGSQWSGLHLAAVYGRMDMVKFLIERGAEVDIFSAACLAELDRVRELVEKNPDIVHARGPDGATPLHFAVGWGVERLAKEKGVQATAIADLLLAHGADVNAKDSWHGGSVLRWSGAGLDGALSRWVREHGAVMDIFETCEAADLARVKQLLEQDRTLVNALTRKHDIMGDENSPLQRAAWLDRVEVAAYLVDQGANLEHRDGDHGATALCYCAWRAHERTAKLLLERGADVNAKNKHGETPLKVALIGKSGGLKHWFAAEPEKYEAVVQLLKDCGGVE